MIQPNSGIDCIAIIKMKNEEKNEFYKSSIVGILMERIIVDPHTIRAHNKPF